MKKTPALLLLTIGGAAGITLLTLFMMFVSFIAAIMIPADGEWALYMVLSIFLFLTSYPFKYLYVFFKEKHRVGVLVFTACLCAPSVIASTAINLMYAPAEQSSLSLLRLALWMFVTIVFTVTLLIHLAVYELKLKRNSPK